MPSMALAQMVKQLREQAGLTQTGVERASRGAVKANHLAQVETGRRGMSWEKASAFAEAVGADEEARDGLDLAREMWRASSKAPPAPPVEDQLADHEARITSLEQRLAAIEGAPTADVHPLRIAAEGDTLPPDDTITYRTGRGVVRPADTEPTD